MEAEITMTMSQTVLVFGLLASYWYLIAMAKGGNPSAGGQVLAGFLALWVLYLMVPFGLIPAVCLVLPMAGMAWYMAYKNTTKASERRS